MPLLMSLMILLALPAVASAQQGALAQPSVPSMVSTFKGVVAYSELDPATGRYRLMHDTNANGSAEPVPVDQRTVPFDVDLGPAADGSVVAVYSRCREEPRTDERAGGPFPVWTTGRGCDVFQYSFREGRETRFEGASTTQASEMLPSVWYDQIAFARVYEQREGRRGIYPYLYVRTLMPGATSRRQPGGARGSTGVPGPMDVELGPQRMAFTWVWERGDGGVSEIRVDDVDRAHQKIDGKGWQESVLQYLTPELGEDAVYYGEQRAMADADGTRSLASRLWRFTAPTGRLARSDAPAQLFAALRDEDARLTITGTTGAFLSRASCGGSPCTIARAGQPSWTTVRTIDARWRTCGDVGYEPQTDAGAFGIRAYDATCEVARTIARGAENRSLPFTLRGFSCTGQRRTESELPSTAITCQDGRRRVTFDRS